VTAAANPTAPATATTAPAIAPTATQVLISTPTVRALNLTPGKMTRLEINHTKNPNAVCNDGSTAIFYFERGRGASINKWVIFFKGGAACWDSRSCAGREQGLLSATAWTQRTLDGGGILSNRPEENPDFSDWNHVFVVYCSSDFWSGTRPDNNTEVKFYFRGHYIVDAVVDAVSDASMIGTPTVRGATQVIFAGSSAGGIGVRINLDRLAKTLSWADVRGVMDAEMVVPTNPAYIQGEEDRRGKAMLEMYKPILDESCQASSAARPWVCFENAYAVANKQIATPMFVRHDLYDPINLEWQDLDPKNPQHRQYIDAAATQYSNILKALPGAFGTATNDHIALELPKFNQDKVDGLTFAQVLGNWYFNRSGPKVVVAPLRR
jgi:hypothetical protein